MRKVALVAAPQHRESVFGGGRRDEMARRTRLIVLSPNEAAGRPDLLHDTEVIFTTWGLPAFTPAQLAAMPYLQAVFYAAGSVQGFARPLLERGITVVSAWRANAVAVAEFTLAQILLGLKGYFVNVREYGGTDGYWTAARGPGAYHETVALLGAGAVGRQVIELLRPFQVDVLVFDPFLTDEQAHGLGVEKVGLEAAFERGQIVSNHLADKPETYDLIDRTLLERLRAGATFINTGRGHTVRESDLAAVCAARPDLTALLDVTYPEPLAEGAALRRLPNVLVSTHIAGAIGNETRRMADLCFAEFDRWERGEPLLHQVTLDLLPTMA